MGLMDLNFMKILKCLTIIIIDLITDSKVQCFRISV